MAEIDTEFSAFFLCIWTQQQAFFESMASYITALEVSTSLDEEEALKNEEFDQININLNEGVPGADRIFLWVKRGDTNPITRVQVTFNQEMEVGLKRLNYTKIEKNLNKGTKGPALHMWYSTMKGVYDVPVIDVNVSATVKSEVDHLKKRAIWEEVSCNLNLGAGGNFVYVWLKREQTFYIRDVTATINTYDGDEKLLSQGYTRVDVNTNMGASESAAVVYIWYRKTTKENESLTALGISTNDDEAQGYMKESYKKVDVNLNKNTTGDAVFLWSKKNVNDDPVRGMVLLCNQEAVEEYKKAGITVIERNLNEGNDGVLIYLCYKA